jgi:hypothetical protein
MTGTCRRAACGVLLLASLLTAAIATAEGSQYVGRPVVDVLLEFRDARLDFIYSSELLPATLRILEEPRSSNRLLIAREILQAHGLGLSVVRPGLYAVVPAARRPDEQIVHGRVLDSTSGEPIATARIVLLPLEAVAWSDAQGRFSIGPVPEGTYALKAEAAGFEAAELPGLSVFGQAAPAELRLTPARTQLSEVVVSTSRYALDRYGAFGSVQFDGDALAAQPVLGEDAIRALGRLPGLAQNGISARSSIRGGETGELLTLLDGFPLRQAFHIPGYQSVFSVLDPGLIDEAEVYTGGFPVRYGNRMAGVFDLRTIDAMQEPRTALGLSVFNAMARQGGKLDAANVDWLAAARVGTLSPIINALALDAGRPTYSDVYARAGHGDPERVRVSANILWSRDELGITREGFSESGKIESKNRYTWLRADRDWDNGIQSSLWLGHSSVDSLRSGNMDKPDIAVGSATDQRSSEYQEIRGSASWQFRPHHWLEAGFEWIAEDAVYRYAAEAAYTDAVAELFSRDSTLLRAIELSPSRERSGVFAAHRWQVNDSLVSEVGLRAQRTVTAGTTAEDWLYDPRISLRWQVTLATALRAHWGRFHQTDEVHELKVEDGLTEFPEAQRSEQLIVGVDHRLRNGLALRLEGFRKLQADPRPHFENLLDPMSVIPEIAPDRVLVAPLAADIKGAEFSLVAEGEDSMWWLGLAWSEARDSVDGRQVPRSWDQTWAATAGMDWTRGSWRFGAVAAAHRGWPTTRLEDSELGVRNGARFSTRASLDLRAEYRKPLTLGSVAFTFELTNAINIGNTCCYKLIADDNGNGDVTFTTKPSHWLPLVPSIGVLWEF